MEIERLALHQRRGRQRSNESRFENGPTRSKLLTVDVVSGQKEEKEKHLLLVAGSVCYVITQVKLQSPTTPLAGAFVSLTELGHVATVDIFVFRVLGVVTKNLDAGWPGRRCAKREQHSSRYILQPRRY